MKKIARNHILKWLLLVVLNVIIIMIVENVPRENYTKYMLSFVPLYAVFYGIFSRFLTKSTLFPTIILFIPFWYILGGKILLDSLYSGDYIGANSTFLFNFLGVCALPGVYCVFAAISSLLTGFVIWLITTIICKNLRREKMAGKRQSNTGE